MTNPQIVAICLVRNEERYLDRILGNIQAFCDRILIADHGSTDRTWAIAERWARQDARFACRRIRHPRESHEMIAPFINTKTWIFAVDGDEIYDPAGLAEFRPRLLAGEYDAYWRVIGSVLNCTELDEISGRAAGYLSPPSRSVTKLFNFNAITQWTNVKLERLHDGDIAFKEGFADATRCGLHERFAWEAASFRCLHVCFLPRSGVDRPSAAGIAIRWNLADQFTRGRCIRLLSAAMRTLGIHPSSRWKMERYMRGELVRKPVAAFFPPRSESFP